MESTNITVAVVTDHAIIRYGLAEFLKKCHNIRLVGEASDKQTALNLIQAKVPNIVLVDIEMALMEPYRLLDVLGNTEGTKLIMVCLRNIESLLLSAIKKGARGFILKESEPKDLEKVIYEVAENNIYLENSIDNQKLACLLSKRVNVQKKNALLSSRELEILQMISEELTSSEIAAKLYLSTRTVEETRQHMMRKIGAKNVTGLLVYGFQNGLISFGQS